MPTLEQEPESNQKPVGFLVKEEHFLADAEGFVSGVIESDAPVYIVRDDEIVAQLRPLSLSAIARTALLNDPELREVLAEAEVSLTTEGVAPFSEE